MSDTLRAMGTFASDVVVHPNGEGRFRAELDHSWDLVPLPQGGIVASFGLRAAEAALAVDAHQLRSATTVFAGQVHPGALEIEVTVLRRGRTASQVATTVRNVGSEAGATTLSVFGTPRSGPSFIDVSMPKVPRPLACRSFRDPPPPGVDQMEIRPFWTRVEGRAALGHPPWEEYEPGTSDVAAWLRFDDPPLLADGSLDPLGIMTLADRMPSSIRERVGPGGPVWFAPSADLTVHIFEPAFTEWLLVHDHARWADDGWASAEATLWSEDGVLVAYATQMMLFTYLDG